MAKRFRDTATYKDRFVKGLPADYKHLWFYILDDCDHAGVWRVDVEGASLYTGCALTETKALVLLAEKIEVISADYWFIPGFIKFQYGAEVNSKAGVIVSARKRLSEFGLSDRLVFKEDSLGTIQGSSQESLETPKSKSKSKDKSKDKNKGLDLTAFEKFWAAYPKKTGKQAALKAWVKASPPLAECLATLAWQTTSEQWVKDHGQFIPMPTTWINQGRWQDEDPKKPPYPACAHPEDKFFLKQTFRDGTKIGTCGLCGAPRTIYGKREDSK